MIGNDYHRSEYDNCVYDKELFDDSFIYLLLYVDDILIACKNISKITGWKLNFKESLKWKTLE